MDSERRKVLVDDRTCSSTVYILSTEYLLYTLINSIDQWISTKDLHVAEGRLKETRKETRQPSTGL